MKHPSIPLILTCCWMLLIFFFSHQPAGVSDGQSDIVTQLIAPITGTLDMDTVTFIVRKSAHFMLYAVLGALLFWTMRSFRHSQHRAFIYATAGAALYAVSDEIHQYFIFGRSAELRDVLVDIAGAVFGILVTIGIIKICSKKVAHDE